MSHMLEVGDGDPWGREGPPEEAYSRVTRDLATVALVPGDSRTATLTIGWTDLPGLTVRVGNSEAHAVHHWIGIKRNP